MSIWGKLAGAAAGLAIGGPIGALLGGVAGHYVIDRDKEEDGPAENQVAFTVGVIALGAKMAKADGIVTGDEVAAFKPGPNLEVVQGNCSACHSADYVNTQPPMKDKKGFWQAEVTKMIKVYGAPIDDADVGKIVDYLATTY